MLINSIYFYPQTNQFSSKQAGICFRVDDNKNITQYTEYAEVFNKYNPPFTFTLNLGKDQITTEYVEIIKDLQSHGHEMMDHTPWHSTYWFSTKLGTEYYKNHPGVPHIYRNNIELNHQNVDTMLAKRSSYFSVNGNFIISNEGIFADFSKSVCYFYFPS